MFGGGGTANTLDYSTSSAGVEINLGTGFAAGGDAEGDTFDDRFFGIIGSDHDDVLRGRLINEKEQLLGGAGDDILFGGDGEDQLFGGDGDDLLIDGGRGDLIDGGAGIDTISVENLNSGMTIDLAAGTASGGTTIVDVENVIGTTKADIITGDASANVLEGRGGDDQLDGGDGIDTADYSASAGGVNVNLTSGTGLGGDAEGDTLVNIENLVGSNSEEGDILTGTSIANVIRGGAGDDVIAGLGGADRLDGGDGSDTADYSASTGRINVNLTTGVALGGDAHGDTLISIENLIGTNSSAIDFLTGDGKDNIIAGLGGADQINGMGGDDTVDYSASAAAINVNLTTGVALGGDAQGDTLASIENLIGSNSSLTDILTGDANANRIEGLAGDDILRGAAGDDVLIGGDGNDRLAGGTGADQIDGGDGIDTADYSASAGRTNVNLATGVGLGGDASGDTLVGIENTIGTNSSLSDFLTGDSNANRIEGLAGDDIISGAGGNDVLLGGAGADQLDGGDGIDTASYSKSAARINVNLSTGVALGGDAHGDTLVSIENLIGTNASATDFLTGNASANRIEGLAGDDIINGAGGNDVLIGGAGADQLDGGDGIDTADYSGSAQQIDVNLTTGLGVGGDAQGDTLAGIENLIGTNLNLTDMETCYKMFRREVAEGIVLRSRGFEESAEFTAKVLKNKKWRIYEVSISYFGRTYEEGKKITWRDGLVAIWALLYYRFAD